MVVLVVYCQDHYRIGVYMDYCLGIYFKTKCNHKIYRHFLDKINSLSLNTLFNDKFHFKAFGYNFKCNIKKDSVLIVDGNLDINKSENIVKKVIQNNEICCCYDFFTIIYYDDTSGVLRIISDPFRSKPLYYIENKDFFVFSTSIKELLQFNNTFDIDFNWIYVIGCNNYSYYSNNIWKNINEIKPQHVISIKGLYVNNYKYCIENIYQKNNYEEILEYSLFKQINSVDAVSLSGGIDSLFLSKYYHKPAYSLSGGIFNYTGEKEIIKKFVNDNKIAHKFVEIPRICSETILEYKNLLFLYALPNFNMEMFYKCILCNEIFREMGNCNFATGQGSDELFVGYSSNCKSYDEYSKKLQRLLFDMCEEKIGLYDSRKNFFSKNYLLTEFYGVFNNFRELELNYELTKLSNNALVTDNFCAKVNSLSNISPYINLDILNYMKNINGETLYDKSIFRKQVSKNLGFRYASIKKNPFIYNKYYYYSYNYIKELILYKNSFKSSLLDEALDSSVFNSGILDKKYFEDFSTIVLKNQIDNTQLELIEVVLKIINAALIYEKYLK